MRLGASSSTSSRIRGHDLLLEMLSGKTDLQGARIFEEGFNFASDRTFGLLLEYLKGRDFSERKNRINLQMAQFDDIKARGLILPHLMARGANLNRADLAETVFDDADFRRAGFKRTCLQRARLKNAYMTGAILTEADLSDADLAGVGLNDANLVRANLSRCNLCAAKLKGARLDNAVLEGADLSGADLSSASMVNANLKNANLEGAIFTRALVKDVIVDGHTRVEGAVNLNLNVRLARPEETRESEMPPPPPPPPPVLHKSFQGQLYFDPERVGLDATRVAALIVSPLTGLPAARVKVWMRIEAYAPEGIPRDIARSLRDNCEKGNFAEYGFED